MNLVYVIIDNDGLKYFYCYIIITKLFVINMPSAKHQKIILKQKTNQDQNYNNLNTI